MTVRRKEAVHHPNRQELSQVVSKFSGRDRQVDSLAHPPIANGIDVVHPDGIKHQSVDAPSRESADSADMTATDDEIPIVVIDTTSIT